MFLGSEIAAEEQVPQPMRLPSISQSDGLRPAQARSQAFRRASAQGRIGGRRQKLVFHTLDDDLLRFRFGALG